MTEREQILSAGVGNLREFGYPEVDTDNILTDPRYSAFFLSMLEDHLGDSRIDQKILKELIETVNSDVKALT